MPLITSIHCDSCPKVKGETNNWFSAIVCSAYFSIQPHFSPTEELGKQFFCSWQCLSEALKKWLKEHNA